MESSEKELAIRVAELERELELAQAQLSFESRHREIALKDAENWKLEVDVQRLSKMEKEQEIVALCRENDYLRAQVSDLEYKMSLNEPSSPRVSRASSPITMSPVEETPASPPQPTVELKDQEVQASPTTQTTETQPHEEGRSVGEMQTEDGYEHDETILSLEDEVDELNQEIEELRGTVMNLQCSLSAEKMQSVMRLMRLSSLGLAMWRWKFMSGNVSLMQNLRHQAESADSRKQEIEMWVAKHSMDVQEYQQALKCMGEMRLGDKMRSCLKKWMSFRLSTAFRHWCIFSSGALDASFQTVASEMGEELEEMARNLASEKMKARTVALSLTEITRKFAALKMATTGGWKFYGTLNAAWMRWRGAHLWKAPFPIYQMNHQVITQQRKVHEIDMKRHSKRQTLLVFDQLIKRIYVQQLSMRFWPWRLLSQRHPKFEGWTVLTHEETVRQFVSRMGFALSFYRNTRLRQAVQVLAIHCSLKRCCSLTRRLLKVEVHGSKCQMLTVGQSIASWWMSTVCMKTDGAISDLQMECQRSMSGNRDARTNLERELGRVKGEFEEARESWSSEKDSLLEQLKKLSTQRQSELASHDAEAKKLVDLQNEMESALENAVLPLQKSLVAAKIRMVDLHIFSKLTLRGYIQWIWFAEKARSNFNPKFKEGDPVSLGSVGATDREEPKPSLDDLNQAYMEKQMQEMAGAFTSRMVVLQKEMALNRFVRAAEKIRFAVVLKTTATIYQRFLRWVKATSNLHQAGARARGTPMTLKRRIAVACAVRLVSSFGIQRISRQHACYCRWMSMNRSMKLEEDFQLTLFEARVKEKELEDETDKSRRKLGMLQTELAAERERHRSYQTPPRGIMEGRHQPHVAVDRSYELVLVGEMVDMESKVHEVESILTKVRATEKLISLLLLRVTARCHGTLLRWYFQFPHRSSG